MLAKNLNDINKIKDLGIIWDFNTQIEKYGMFAKEFVQLKLSLVEESPEYLAEILGFSKEELNEIINSDDDESIAELMGISNEDLTIMYNMGILDKNNNHIKNSTDIKNGGIDAFDGTPVIDLKAYFPICDRVRDCHVAPWLKNWPECLEDGIIWWQEQNFFEEYE